MAMEHGSIDRKSTLYKIWGSHKTCGEKKLKIGGPGQKFVNT
jgi:hypothetical protein